MQRLLPHPYVTALRQILPEVVNRQPGMQYTFRIALQCSVRMHAFDERSSMPGCQGEIASTTGQFGYHKQTMTQRQNAVFCCNGMNSVC